LGKNLDRLDFAKFNLLQPLGKIKFADAGLGFKESGSGKVTTLAADDIEKFQWIRAARDYQLRIIKKDRSTFKFEGFERDVRLWTMIIVEYGRFAIFDQISLS
jgi:hypothetical protein